MARKQADGLVDEGTPVVFFRYGSGRFEWCDGEEAQQDWQEERRYVITTEPTSKALSKHHLWHAGLWESAVGDRLLFLTGRC